MQGGSTFGALDSAWRALQTSLRAQARVLIVDGDQTSRLLLEQLLKGEGYQVDTATSAGEAWAMIEARPYSLLVADKSLRDGSGLELITRTREAGKSFPCVLSSAFPTVAAIAEAIGAGASDYLSKPFPDLSRLVTRLQSLLEQRLAEKLYTRISEDLTAAIKAKGESAADLTRIGARLFEFKQSLGSRPSVLLVEASAGMAEVAQDALAVAGISSEAVTCLDAARERLADSSGPLTAVVSLGIPRAVEFIAEQRRADPLLEIVASAPRPTVEQALLAVEAGAADIFSRASESLDALQARVRRAVDRSRRQRLYVHLIRTLCEEASCIGIDPEAILALVPPDHRRLITLTPFDCDRGRLPCERDSLSPESPVEEERQRPAVPIQSASEQPAPAKPPPAPSAPLPAAARGAVAVAPAPAIATPPAPAPSSPARVAPAPEKTGFERRAAPRYPCSIIVLLRPWGTPSSLLPCRIRDISLGGMFIHLPVPPPIGTRFEIRIDPTQARIEGEPIDLLAEVVRSIRVEPDPAEQTGVGVRLLETPPSLLAKLTLRAATCGEDGPTGSHGSPD